MAIELKQQGVAALSLWAGVAVETGQRAIDLARSEGPRFSGRAVAVLARDPDVMDESGQTLRVAGVARATRFSDVG